ncbi:MAG: DUF5671 domain-containing protein [Candidatus Paceibacterota bacterium]|jgi:hypothetical protein
MNTTTTPKDFFLHLGATIALYAVAISLINLSFGIINYLVPDALASDFYASSVAWPISMLVVLVPLLYTLEWIINRDIRLIPEKATIFISRWRVYLTLFLAGATIVGDLIALINVYLSGEITMRFVWKILAILVICGIIFAYYLLQRTDVSGKNSKICKILAWAGIVISVTAIIGGFIVAGSPWTRRALRFDQQRINDLSNIQYQMVSYWQKIGKLPTNLTDLNDPVYGTIVPSDPETKVSYEYRIKPESSKSPFTFELCAEFSLPTRDVSGRGDYYGGTMYASDIAYPQYYPILELGDLWKHEAGRQCFERSIDPVKHASKTNNL